jgi:hypothetical protein
VSDRNSGALSPHDSDRLIKWFIGVLVIAVGVNLLSSLVAAQKWAWLPPAVFVAALLVAVRSTGLLRRERYDTTRAREIITEGAIQSPIPRTGSSLLAAALAAVIFRSWNRAYRDLAAIEERDSGADRIPDVYDATTPATTGSAPPTADGAACTLRGWG